jgi:pseudouridine synthase
MLVLSRPPSQKALERLRKGVRIGEGQFTKPLSVSSAGPCRLRIVLTTGRNREVRRLSMVCRLYLAGLERIRYGPVRLSGLKRGTFRILTPDELRKLYGSVDLEPVEY